MVCDRCIMVVKQQLEELNYEVTKVKLGEAEIEPEPDESGMEKINRQFAAIGFELIVDKKQKLSEKIKTLIIEKINNENGQQEVNWSSYLSDRMGMDYHYLSHVFSEISSSTIEKFIIIKKIEKVKEFLRYDELTISEIAWKYGYSSVQALSNQFKKVTGMTPSEYKKSESQNTK